MPARRQNGPRSGTHLGTSAATARSAKAEIAESEYCSRFPIVNEVVNAIEAVKSYGQPGFWILLSILIVLVLVIAAVMYQRIVINRFKPASKATHENFETIAAD